MRLGVLFEKIEKDEMSCNKLKLFIHAGLHKTGTSSFQYICSTHSKRLADIGVYYPHLTKTQDHNSLMHEIQKSGSQSIKKHLTSALEELPENCNIVLLSGEDFENCVVDTRIANSIENSARDLGFREVEWGVIFRDTPSYVASLYSQKSNHPCIVDYESLAFSAKHIGYASVATRNFVYLFALDYARLSEDFQKNRRRYSSCI